MSNTEIAYLEAALRHRANAMGCALKKSRFRVVTHPSHNRYRIISIPNAANSKVLHIDTGFILTLRQAEVLVNLFAQ